MLWDEDVDDLILAGASNLSIDNTDDSSSTTTGSFHTDGGVGIAKKLYVGTDLDVDGTSNLDAVDIDGAVQLDATLTVGVDDTGYDVKLFGATSGQYMLWDEDADELALVGDTKLSFHDAAGGENIIATSDGHLEVNAGTTLDITAPTVDINAATLIQVDGEVKVGVAGTGNDVYFYGDTAAKYLLWDQSGDELALINAAKLSFWDAAGGENIIASADGHLEVNAGPTLDITAPTVDINVATTLNVDGVTQLTGAVTVGVDGTGHDLRVFGATSNRDWFWDASANEVIQRGALTVGVDDTGHDVKFFGATASKYWRWDQTNDQMLIVGDTTQTGNIAHTGALTIGVDGTGHDVIFYGDSASTNMTWDQNGNTDGQLILNDARLYIDQDDDDIGILIDSESASQAGISIYAKYGIAIDQDVSGGWAASISRNIAEAGSAPLVSLVDEHASVTQSALRVRSDGVGSASHALEVIGRMRLGGKAAAIQNPTVAWVMS